MIQGTIDQIFWGDLDMLTFQIRNLGNIGVVSSLGQGGLCSLSALVLDYKQLCQSSVAAILINDLSESLILPYYFCHMVMSAVFRWKLR